jgi:hypothetical protein
MLAAARQKMVQNRMKLQYSSWRPPCFCVIGIGAMHLTSERVKFNFKYFNVCIVFPSHDVFRSQPALLEQTNHTYADIAAL